MFEQYLHNLKIKLNNFVFEWKNALKIWNNIYVNMTPISSYDWMKYKL
jgi:hypothetical protein